MLLQNLYVLLSLNGAFMNVQVTRDAMCTDTPPNHHRGWLLNFATITVWMVLFLFGLDDPMASISKKDMKCGLRPQHTIPLQVSPSLKNSGPETLAQLLDVVDIQLSLCKLES